MSTLPDYELQKTVTESSPPSPDRTHRGGVWIAVALLAVAAGVAVYVILGRRSPPATPMTSSRPIVVPKPTPPRSLGGTAEQIELPPLDESDPLVRRLVGALSGNPVVVAWLTTNGLIRTFVVAVVNTAEGVTPAKHVKALRPSAGFQAVARNGSRYIDPRSYDRYALIADAVVSLDAAGAARLYTTLKPRIEEAYRELGFPDGGFDRTLERAIVALLRTPIVNDPIRIRPKGTGDAYADDQLENLTPAQKQLLRMGPRNVRCIEERLREIALALGIPSSELPPI